MPDEDLQEVAAPTTAEPPAGAEAPYAPERPYSIVCISSQAWEAPLPTNRQQIMRRAGSWGHEVLFVETGRFLGRLLWQLVRGPDRLRLLRKLAAAQQVAPGVRVARLWNVLPLSQRLAFSNRAAWRLGARRARRAAARLPGPRVLWIYDPRGAEAIGTFGEAFAVYDCVDDYPQQAGSSRGSRALLTSLDARAGAGSRLVFATTPSLVERQRHRNPRTHHVANVGDFEHFRSAADRATAAPELHDLARPVLGFAGNFLESKVDFDLLAAVGSAFAEGTLLLAGPAKGAAAGRLEQLLRTTPNARWLGLQPYAKLPSVVAAFDVGLIPYLENEYTRSCFPLKLYEYLAAGKPVVASGLPSIAGLGPHVQLTGSADEFVDAVQASLSAPADVDGRMALASGSTWEGRARRLLSLVSAELDA